MGITRNTNFSRDFTTYSINQPADGPLGLTISCVRWWPFFADVEWKHDPFKRLEWRLTHLIGDQFRSWLKKFRMEKKTRTKTSDFSNNFQSGNCWEWTEKSLPWKSRIFKLFIEKMLEVDLPGTWWPSTEINRCFSWMLPNHYMKNAWWTKHS